MAKQILSEEFKKMQKLAGVRLNENLDWRDDIIYDTLINSDLEQLVSNMLAAVEENSSITLFDFLKRYEDDED